MPIISPTNKESQNDFMQRCLGSEVVKKEFPNHNQAVAVCLHTYSKNKSNGSTEPKWEDAETKLKKELDEAKGIFEIEVISKMQMHCDNAACNKVIADMHSPKSNYVSVAMKDKNGYYQNHSYCSLNCAHAAIQKCMADSEMDDSYARDVSIKERNALKDSDFVDVEHRAFPISDSNCCTDVKAAVSSFGRGRMAYEPFKKRLIEIAKRKGCGECLPKEWTN